MSECLVVTRAAGYRVLTLNRPDKLNALDPELLKVLRREQEDLSRDPECAVVVLRGAGRAFCVGADLQFVKSIRADRPAVEEFLSTLHSVVSGFEALPQVVVAAVHGMVLAGGLELMMGCDIVVAARSCKLGDQHAKFGLVPGGGGTQRLARLVGPLRAKDLILTGRWVMAEEAATMGLITSAVADESFDSEVDSLVESLLEKSATAAAVSKHLVNAGLQLPLQGGLALEVEAVKHHFESADFAIGLEAFERREKPRFPHRRSGPPIKARP
jgi:enoyl-CoA hydratase/carnithine racemase